MLKNSSIFQHFMMMLKFKICELRNSGDMERIIDTSQRLEEQYNILNNNFSTNPCEFIKKMQHLLCEVQLVVWVSDFNFSNMLYRVHWI